VPKKTELTDGKIMGRISGVSDARVSPKNIMSSGNSRLVQLKLLFSPSD
jgi:hypothetical protein